MEAQATDRSGAIQADIAFHSRLAEASHNGLFLSIMRCFEVLLRANFEMVMAVDGRYIRNLAEHRIVAEAVMKHDAAGARCAMQKLLENNAEDLSQLLPAT
jgi:DNA-binding FadR family transcriptional regulator